MFLQARQKKLKWINCENGSRTMFKNKKIKKSLKKNGYQTRLESFILFYVNI